MATVAEAQVLALAVQHGLVSSAAVETLRVEPDATASSLVERLIVRELLDEDRLADLLAAEAGLPRLPPGALKPDPEALARLPAELIRRVNVLPLRVVGSSLHVALGDPLDLDSVDRLAHTAGLSLELYVAPWRQLRDAIEAAVERRVQAGDSRNGRSKAAVHESLLAKDAETGDEPVIRWVDDLVAEAVRRRASDIHVEPVAAGLRVRYRVDGVLQPGRPAPAGLEAAVISRLKLIAHLSLAERRVPQDGRVRVRLANGSVDLRVASIPTVQGESIVLRLLSPERLEPGLAALGLAPADRDTLLSLLGLPNGLVLVTGPTGSGKSTTLYSCLQYLNRPDRKIITVEDPIEIPLPGINQVPVRADSGLGFSDALRAILRQSPNVVMVGEIRDAETAEVALHAALTGHLVFSTLHTNDAPGAITRLLDLGIKPFLVAAALRGVVAQRLVRRVCDRCARPEPIGAARLRSCGCDADTLTCATPRSGEGCPACFGSGFRGRVGLFEFLVPDERMQAIIHQRVGVGALRTAARACGWRTLREDGLRKAASGVTTLDDVLAQTVGAAG